ncbi:hypothetical protein QUF80_05990 [Desulfococcaceae bacterium HSG8]|nr:hypothetical protein [Desulfococcaceae bacterium HSG8]
MSVGSLSVCQLPVGSCQSAVGSWQSAVAQRFINSFITDRLKDCQLKD